MKIHLKNLLLLFFSVLFVFVLSACTNNSSTQSTTTTLEGEEPIVLAGEYEVDITDLGMPMIVYLKIDADDNFFLAPDRTFTVDKGHGTISSIGDTYMFIYSDSTPDTPKTSTFKIENNNLHFETALPYGSSNLRCTAVDEENPDITYYLVANKFLFEDYLGDYAGSHSVTAMSSTIDYEYTLKLKTGCTYVFTSTFELEDETYEFIEKGAFSINGTAITLTPEGGSALVGVINADSSLDVSIQVSEMAERATHNLKVATTAAFSGTYYGIKTIKDGETIISSTLAVVVLDKFGNYTYTATESVSGDEPTASGTFSVSGSAITFTPTVGTAQTGSIANYVLKSKFMLTEEATAEVEITFYRENVQGVFTAVTTVEEVDFEAELILNVDGTFSVTITQVGGEVIFDEEGTFTLTRMLFVSLNLKVGTTTYACVVSLSGLNVNFIINEVTYGFILKK